MEIKRNIIYSLILVLGNYLFPLITFPYVSRVLGVTQIGVVNFVDSIVNYYIMFSMLGLSILGIREIAKSKNNALEISRVFSTLLALNFIITILLLVIYLSAIFIFPQLYTYRYLLYIGAVKLFFNVFLLEWLYRGLENFKYITICSLLLRSIYVVSLFVLVKNANDVLVYYMLTVSLVVFMAIVNTSYSTRHVKFCFKNVHNLRFYIKPYVELGIYLILTSMYTTFNVIYLGFVSTQDEVGYYVTALKIYTIILGAFTAFTNVMMPRMSALLSDRNSEDFQKLTRSSFYLFISLSFPIICYVISMAPDIIYLIAGDGYEGAITPMRIIIVLILFVGLAQILAIQVLIPLKKDKIVLKAAFVGAVIGIIFNVVLVKLFSSVGTAITLCISEISVTLLLLFYVIRNKVIQLPWIFFFKNILYSIVPYFLISICVKLLNYNFLINLFVVMLAYSVYFLFSQIGIVNNPVLLYIIKKNKYV